MEGNERPANVLVVTYYFPPAGGGGVQRALKFVKYLPRCGFAPVVLTVRDPDVAVHDASLLDDVPVEVPVYRTYAFDPVRWYKRRRARRAAADSPTGEAAAGHGARLPWALRHPTQALWAAIKYVLTHLVLVPDDYVGWIPFAVGSGLRIIRRERIDVIYATGKPWSAFLVARLLGMLTGRPYVLDLRDPWVLTPYGGVPRTSVRGQVEGWLEGACFAAAAKVININDRIHDVYRCYYPTLPRQRFTCIPHGFDREDFGQTRARRSDATLRMAYVGTIYPNTTPDALLGALRLVVTDPLGLRAAVRLTVVGFVPPRMGQLVETLGLNDIVELIGYVPHAESIAHMINADVLVLLLDKVSANPQAQVTTGKLFEYLAAHRPILALVPRDTDAAHLIGELGAGTVVDPADEPAIEAAIRDLCARHRNGGLNGHTGQLDRFEREHQTRALAAILRAAMTGGGDR